MTTNSTSVKTAATLVKASRTAFARKWSFLAISAYIMFVSVGAAAKFDVLPEPAKSAEAEPTVLVTAPVQAQTAPELPTKIEIPTIDLSQKVSNPESTNISVLDNALLTGTVRHPSSSKLGEEGTMIIFGHSSYLPIVNNKSFKAFNGIQKLEKGDLITVTGSEHSYVYAVQSVSKESATSDAIPLYSDGYTLTLATCDSFGEKTDRFVVTATLVETKNISQ